MKRPAPRTAPLQFGSNCGRENSRAIAAELFVDLFEAADEIDHLAAGIGSAGGGAKVRAAAEWPVIVDEAP
jgi:hypothetical protein